MVFVVIDFLQKTNKRIRLYYYDTSGRLVFVHFLEEIDDPKKHFEINWPLSYLAFRLTIFFPKISNSCNQQIPAKGTKFQTCCNGTFCLAFCLHVYWTPEGARVKKEEDLSNQKCYLGSKCIFWFSKCSSFFTRRFLYILGCSGPRCGGSAARRRQTPPRICDFPTHPS